MFKGDSADTCAEKFPLMLMGGRANDQACADGERGPPSAWANFPLIFDCLRHGCPFFIHSPQSLQSLHSKTSDHGTQNKLPEDDINCPLRKHYYTTPSFPHGSSLVNTLYLWTISIFAMFIQLCKFMIYLAKHGNKRIKYVVYGVLVKM